MPHARRDTDERARCRLDRSIAELRRAALRTSSCRGQSPWTGCSDGTGESLLRYATRSARYDTSPTISSRVVSRSRSSTSATRTRRCRARRWPVSRARTGLGLHALRRRSRFRPRAPAQARPRGRRSASTGRASTEDARRRPALGPDPQHGRQDAHRREPGRGGRRDRRPRQLRSGRLSALRGAFCGPPQRTTA